MILIDFSAILHQSVFSGINNAEPKKDDTGHYITKDFISFSKYYLLENLFNVQTEFYSYGNIVLCLDDHSIPNWRKRIYHEYKMSRKSHREQSEIYYNEVFAEFDGFVKAMNDYSPWKVVQVPGAEGDDVVLELAKRFAPSERILIVSSDKDMIQAQKYGDVKQYSLLTKKFITTETKHDDTMKDWLMEHVILGDTADEVPKVVDRTKFSDEFQAFINDNHLVLNEITYSTLPNNLKTRLNNAFFESEYDRPVTVKCRRSKANPDGVQTVKPGIFKKERFGKKALEKKIAEYGSLENWVNSNPLYKRNYERNKRLVLAEYIPMDISRNIDRSFDEASNEYSRKQFIQYMRDNGIASLEMQLPPNFVSENSLMDFF